jgi:hypothetical protein
MFLTNLRRTAVIGLAFALVALVGCGKGKTETSPAPAATQPPEGKTPRPTKGSEKTASANPIHGEPNFEMTAQQYFDIFQKDREAAGQKFDDELVTLKGVVGSFGVDEEVDHVNLQVGDNVTAIKCHTRERAPWAKVFPGQTIRIRGRQMHPFEPHLVKCTIVEVGPESPTVVSAQELAKEFAADRDKLHKKYAGKYLWVEGEVIEKQGGDVFLKGSGKLKVHCEPPFENQDILDVFVVGKKVKLLGKYNPREFLDEAPRLTGCLPISPRK